MNARRSGGGGSVVRAEGGSGVEMENCRVTNCSADGNGGAVFVSSGSLVVRRSHFEENSAADKGGALAVVDGGRGTLTESTFMNCFAEQGGALYAARASTLKMEQMRLSLNHALANSGGALFVEQRCVVNLSAAVVTENTAVFGGAMEVSHGSLLGVTAGVR